MSSKVVKTHQTCPKCNHDECFTLFDDGNGYCHSTCNGFVKLVESEGRDAGSLVPFVGPYRGLTPDEYGKHGGMLVAQEGDDKPYAMIYTYPHATKMRKLQVKTKREAFGDNRGFTNDHWFGQDQYNAGSSKVITIVEGEDDRFAALKILGGKWPVISSPGASLSKELIKNTKDYLDSFANIVIASDSDEAGEQMAEYLARLFPNKCYRVSMTKYGDAMEYLENDAGDEWLYAWINRQKYVMPFDTNTPDQFKKLFHESKDLSYLPTGIKAFDDVALGLFQGQLTVFTAPEGIGKTEFMRMLEYGLIRDFPDVPFAYCHLEEQPQRSLLGLASYHLNKNVTRKELITDDETEEEVLTAIDEMMGRETIHQFKISPDEDPDVLVERIKYYANVCDCKYVFFEPIQDIAHQRRAGDLTEFLDKLSVNLSRTAADTGVGIITIAHANQDGDTRDSKQIQKQAAIRVELQRDMENDDPITGNTTHLVMKKNRPVGTMGHCGSLLFNPDTFVLEETDGMPF
jgi:5S rRNA maturation endonuclease (ribonuclease M5)/energy-coupling factor transporter ATP-binding protein EcfA2